MLKAELTQKRNTEAIRAVSFQRQAAEKLTDGQARYARKATCLGHRIRRTAAPPHRKPLPQARQEARAGLKRGVGSGNHCLMRADSPEKRVHALSLALGKPLLVLLRFRCPCLLLVGDALL